MSNGDDNCPMRGGQKTKGATTFTADLGGGVMVVLQVRATICSQCGEEWIDDETARQLELIGNDARDRRLQLEVAEFKRDGLRPVLRPQAPSSRRLARAAANAR